jgi:hypothetical protein
VKFCHLQNYRTLQDCFQIRNGQFLPYPYLVSVPPHTKFNATLTQTSSCRWRRRPPDMEGMQLRTSDKGWSSSLEFGRGANKSP